MSGPRLPAWPGGRFRTAELATDPRFELFGALFAFSLVHHTMQQIVEQQRIGPFTEFMERWGPARPSLPLPSSAGVAILLGVLTIGALATLLPGRRAWLAALGPLFVLSWAAMPEAIDSHTSVVTAGLVLIGLLALLEIVDRRLSGASAATRGTVWLEATVYGLRGLAALLYFFAFFYKLNPTFLSLSSSPATQFLVDPIEPLAGLAGITPDQLEQWLRQPAVWGTVAIELALPPLLFVRRTRLAGLLLGLLLHLPMLAQGVADFPIAAISLYALFLTPAELAPILAAIRRRPPLPLALVVGIGTAYGSWIIARSDNLARYYGDPAASHLAVMAAHHLLLFLALGGALYLFCVLAARLPWPAVGRRRATVARPLEAS